MPEDPRALVIRGLQQLRDSSQCGYCRDDYDSALRLVESEGEFEGNMRTYVRRNPVTDQVRERTRQVQDANREVLSRMGMVPAPRDRLVRFRVGDVTSTVRSWREELASVRPRPLQGLLGDRQRGR